MCRGVTSNGYSAAARADCAGRLRGTDRCGPLQRRAPKRLFALALITVLVTFSPRVSAESFDGTYLGKRVLTKGGGPSCPAQDDVSITITTGALTFTDSALKNYAIGFDPHPDGSFILAHVDMGGRVVDIHGRIAGNSLDADVTNAPCEYHWHAEKK